MESNPDSMLQTVFAFKAPVREKLSWALGPFFHGLVACLCLFQCPAAVAGMQSRLGASLIDGIATDTALHPIGGTTVWIVGTSALVASDTTGRFRIGGLSAGDYDLLIRRVGYRPLSIHVPIGAADTVRLSVTLTPSVVELNRVTVRATSAVGRLAEFEARRRLGQGQFLNQEQIERLNVAGLSDVFRISFLGVAVGSTANAMRSIPGRTCPFQFFVDGVAIPTPRSMDDDLPTTKELAGIEVYTNSTNVPLQYKTAGGDIVAGRPGGGFCGVILLWTRSG